MKYVKLDTALCSLYNWATQSVTKALDYGIVFDIKHTKPREELVFLIGLASNIIKVVESYCENEQHLNVLRFKYGYLDRRGDKDLLPYIGALAYPKNPKIGEEIALNWREDKFSKKDNIYTKNIMNLLNVTTLRRAQQVASEGRNELEKKHVYLIDNKLSPCYEIEQYLLSQDILFKNPKRQIVDNMI